MYGCINVFMLDCKVKLSLSPTVGLSVLDTVDRPAETFRMYVANELPVEIEALYPAVATIGHAHQAYILEGGHGMGQVKGRQRGEAIV